ncbi:MAG: hypothetical protein JRI50_09115 [Deltaproteobacteria bacterium]|nr:hypothetical protein [Deltaproteobacteria bacterium]
MTIDDYLDSEDFLLFLDETLRQQACQAVDFFLERNEPAAKTQLYSIPAMIQAKGLEGLNKLTKKQKEKNTNQTNKQFWEFVRTLIDVSGGQPPPFSLVSLVRQELTNNNLLDNEARVSEKAEQKKIRKANRNLTIKVMERALPVYFEHFNCHYFYKSR